MAETVNQQIADALTAQQLKDARVEAQLRREVWEILGRLEAEVVAALTANDPTAFALLARRRQAVEQLLTDALDPMIQIRYGRIAVLLDEALLRLARHEARTVERVVNEATGADTITEQPTERQLRAGVVQGLFPSTATPTDLSTTGQDWWQRQGVSLSQRVGDSLMVGVSLEESLPHLTQRVRGTRDAAFKDGLMGKARDDAARLLTTQVTNAVGEARGAVAARNATQVVLQHHALIESRNVCTICFVRHGKRYTATVPHEPLGHDFPYLAGVPYHPLCRCSMLTVVASGGAITEETLAAWLRRQGLAYQQAVLGATRAHLFQAGKLTPNQLLEASSGRPLTLEELGA